MNNAKLVSFFGDEREDIPYYLAKSFAEKGKKVLIVDNTLEQQLYNCMRKEEADGESIERQNMAVISHRLFSDACYDKFDLVVVMHGLSPDKTILNHSHKVIFMTPFLKSEVERIAANVDVSEIMNGYGSRKKIYLYVDKASGKIPETYLKKFYSLKNTEDEFTIPANENDMGLRLSLQYNGEQQVKGCSSEIRDFIKTVTMELESKRRNLLEDDNEETNEEGEVE